jgi:WD40 repeat protein
MIFSPDGQRLAMADLNGAVQVWELGADRLAFPVLQTAAPLTGLAYSPDGRRLAVAGRDDRVRLYDALLGHELVQLRCLGEPTNGGYDFFARAVFSPDGRRLAANGWDGKVTIWTSSPRGLASPSQR